MTGLALIVAEAGGARVELALETAAAAAALGAPVRLFLAREGLALLADDGAALLTLGELGARIAVCQGSMAAAGLQMADLPPAAEALGLVAFLAETAGFRLLLA